MKYGFVGLFSIIIIVYGFCYFLYHTLVQELRRHFLVFVVPHKIAIPNR